MATTAPPVQPAGFAKILSEALTRIPVHNPEYTNYLNQSDPGNTILQLFAFMVDNLSYLCNQIPDQNRLKFLELLGIPMQPPQAASGMVTFSNTRGPLQTVTLPAHLPVFAGSTGFVTSDGLDVLPVDSMVFMKQALSPAEQTAAAQTYAQLYAAQAAPPAQLQYYQTETFDPPRSGVNLPQANLNDGSIVDGAVWIALLTRDVDAGANQAVVNAIAGYTLTLGILPDNTATDLTLQPSTAAAPPAASPLIYEISTGQPGSSPVYQRLNAIPNNNPLTQPTLVQLTLPEAGAIGVWQKGPLEEGVGDYPPSLQDQTDIAARVIAWIRVRLPNSVDGQGPAAAPAIFNWVGINASQVSQQIQVPIEIIGTGSGEPDQTFTLRNTPVLTDTVQLTVDGTLWTQTNDLLAAPSEIEDAANSRQYAADSASGTITFGTGLQGARPPAGSTIIAQYFYGGGVAGNVGIGAISASPQLPAGFLVSNPLPTVGGTAGESVDDAQKRIPLYLQNRERAVSAQDFIDIVNSTPGLDLGRVEVLPLYQPGTGVSVPGVVTVMVIPNDPKTPQGPVPDAAFLQAVCNYLEPKRLVTTEIHVLGPDYQNLSVSVGFDMVPGKDVATVTEGVRTAISTYLSPLKGGIAGTGWPLGKPVTTGELLAQAARVDGISDIQSVTMWDVSHSSLTNLPITNVQLPRLVQVGANLGPPNDVTQTSNPSVPSTLFPVPVAPVGC